MSQTQPPVMVLPEERGPGCLIRLLYFVFIGLWVGGAVTLIAWVLNITIIGLPLGLWLLNRLPVIMTLHPVRRETQVVVVNGRVLLRRRDLPQYPFLVRAAYFLLIGWWFSLLWMGMAWLLTGLSLGLGLPLAFWMFDQVPFVTTLARL
ncbi:hypothetical protein SE15_13345 [Thermanaerothrix daxensis]|uniref:YccF domain-containing protein n=1 Tax=Thermanaerothrix daxensis TaxID=869279 RepID=A0A0P6XNS1_9CHLR|nr:hypothetical protein [Thermanaerothrix daxensis]KPL82083.1 hypothetical protein SE15_13345 [Thermanaerothrix daxensis]